MDAVLPWKEWAELVRPFFPDGKRGRPPQEIERVMLRMLMLQVWFQLSDERVEDAIYDNYAMKSFLGLNFAKGAQVPDATTLYPNSGSFCIPMVCRRPSSTKCRRY